MKLAQSKEHLDKTVDTDGLIFKQYWVPTHMSPIVNTLIKDAPNPQT